jgi:hypothetical protein
MLVSTSYRAGFEPFRACATSKAGAIHGYLGRPMDENDPTVRLKTGAD